MSGQTLSLVSSLYTPTDCRNRVSQIQKLCEASSIGAVLLIAGMDAKENEGSTKAINYLFSGISGHDLQVPILYQESFDELVVLVMYNHITADNI
jgi:hypothetical protein